MSFKKTGKNCRNIFQKIREKVLMLIIDQYSYWRCISEEQFSPKDTGDLKSYATLIGSSGVYFKQLCFLLLKRVPLALALLSQFPKSLMTRTITGDMHLGSHSSSFTGVCLARTAGSLPPGSLPVISASRLETPAQDLCGAAIFTWGLCYYTCFQGSPELTHVRLLSPGRE